MKINILSDKILWFGKYSGYECLTDYFSNDVKIAVTIPKYVFLNKLFGKFLKIYLRWNKMSHASAFAGITFLFKSRRYDISHILYLENHLHLLSLSKNNREKKIVGTIHLPFNQWSEEGLKLLSKLDSAIILYEEEVTNFAKYIPPNMINVIKHGVDIDFFKPNKSVTIQKNKVLFVGHYLRNFNMLYEVYQILEKKFNNELEYHFIIPTSHRHPAVVKKIIDLPNTFFHEGLSDEELLEFYQNSYLLMMPMDDCGANTAIIQALSTGLPIITTDVGGIRSYGGNEIFPVVPNNASAEMADLFEKYYTNPHFRDLVAAKERQFALEQLDWNLISEKHMNVYQKLIKKRTIK